LNKQIWPLGGGIECLKMGKVYHIELLHAEILIERKGKTNVLPEHFLIRVGSLLPGFVFFTLLASSNAEGVRRYSLGYTHQSNFEYSLIQEIDPDDFLLYIGWHYISPELTEKIKNYADIRQ
jgi:hypothetical protein